MVADVQTGSFVVVTMAVHLVCNWAAIKLGFRFGDGRRNDDRRTVGSGKTSHDDQHENEHPAILHDRDICRMRQETCKNTHEILKGKSCYGNARRCTQQRSWRHCGETSQLWLWHRDFDVTTDVAWELLPCCDFLVGADSRGTCLRKPHNKVFEWICLLQIVLLKRISVKMLNPAGSCVPVGPLIWFCACSRERLGIYYSAWENQWNCHRNENHFSLHFPHTTRILPWNQEKIWTDVWD